MGTKKEITSKSDFFNWSNDEKLKNSEFFVECESATFQLLWAKHFYDKPEDDRMDSR